ncbi:PREDICTED: shadow of prion protein [Myotis brandtii]|uniref:shadow of prion protein n=1 Tax=Myotis brandtii TaxID=109478 RepID=UPI0003BB986D|nr:PREDICTED: shadow of prion protein [Myotis brandtii]
MNWMAATCWALLLAAAFLCDSGETKGGRGGASSGSGWRRALGPWESDLEDEDTASGGNRTAVYSYWAWTSDAGPMCRLHLCLLLGGALSALGLLQP